MSDVGLIFNKADKNLNDFKCYQTCKKFNPKSDIRNPTSDLPPILNMHIPNPISSCSKASRGLFVQLWLTCIFTGLVISPSTSLRQFSSCYAIRAGRNLPGKEFRSNSGGKPMVFPSDAPPFPSMSRCVSA